MEPRPHAGVEDRDGVVVAERESDADVDAVRVVETLVDSVPLIDVLAAAARDFDAVALALIVAVAAPLPDTEPDADGSRVVVALAEALPDRDDDAVEEAATLRDDETVAVAERETEMLYDGDAAHHGGIAGSKRCTIVLATYVKLLSTARDASRSVSVVPPTRSWQQSTRL